MHNNQMNYNNFQDATVTRLEEFIKASLSGCFNSDQQIKLINKFKSTIQNTEFLIGSVNPGKQLQICINQPDSAKAAFTELKPCLDYIAQCLYKIHKDEALKFLYALSDTAKQIADAEIRKG